MSAPVPPLSQPPGPGDRATHRPPAGRGWRVPVAIAAAVAAVLAAGHALLRRAAAGTNQLALAAEPRGVTVVRAVATRYRPMRRYVGTLAPWHEARLGPQLVSAYVSTVRVRTGARVRRDEVIATLDCRGATANSRAVAQQAQALATRQAALARQVTRMSGLVEGGFASADEVEQRAAASASEAARLAAARAELSRSALTVRDCVLRAPFDGEVAARRADPGAFVRPGDVVVTVVDRSVARAVVDVPETDYDHVAPGTPVRVRLLAAGRELAATVTRRAPSADAATRSVAVEVDLPDPERRLPVGTTAELLVSVGAPADAVAVPVTAASVRGARATVFVIEQGVARRRRVALLGERAGDLYLEPGPLADAQVVVEGRGLLGDGDPVRVLVQPYAPTDPSEAPAADGGEARP